MREQLRIEWERMVRGRMFYIAVGIGLLIAVMQIVGEVYPCAVNPLRFYSGQVGEPYSLYYWCMGMYAGSLYKEIYITVFPVLAMMPYALSYHMDAKSGYIKNVYTRTKKINYLVAKYIVTFVGAGITIVIPYVVNLIIAASMLPALTPIYNGEYNSGAAMMQAIYYSKPLLYIFIYLIINFLYAGAFASIVLAAAYYIDNIFMLGISPTSGSAAINGETLGKQISFPRSVGVLIENPAFIPGYTGLKNLEVLASIQKRIDRDKICSTLAEIGLDYNDKRTYRKYSLGMKQRLGIAAAVMEEPNIVILDEPINALDESGAMQVRDILKKQKDRGAVCIIACHDTEELEYLSDVIIEIKDGAIV